MNEVKKCIICKSKNYRILFNKESAYGELFTLAKCRQCGMEFLLEAPEAHELEKYYKKEYFTRRTSRGYDDYFSSSLRAEIERVFKLNLEDLNFFEFEKRLSGNKSVLDIGCAAGYFVSYMKDRSWKSTGVEISHECVDFAKKLDLDVMQGDYLDMDFQNKFHLITLWATIEHLYHPAKVLEKVYNDLEDNGMLYISTCRVGGVNFMRLFGKEWRYYNFPEHLYFFSIETLKKLLKQNGFEVKRIITYGSGFGKSGTRLRKIADFLAKKLYLGDMMLVSAIKSRN